MNQTLKFRKKYITVFFHVILKIEFQTSTLQSTVKMKWIELSLNCYFFKANICDFYFFS